MPAMHSPLGRLQGIVARSGVYAYNAALAQRSFKG